MKKQTRQSYNFPYPRPLSIPIPVTDTVSSLGLSLSLTTISITSAVAATTSMSRMNFDVESFPGLCGKVAIITGGSSGIGLATARLFAAQGAKVIIGDMCEPLEAVPDGTVFVRCDVTRWEDQLALFDAAVARHGVVDIVVANAGIGLREDFFVDDVDADTGRLRAPSWRAIDVNLKGVLNSVKLALSHFQKDGRGGRIVLTASTAGYMGETGVPEYSAAKHGVSRSEQSTRKPTDNACFSHLPNSLPP